MADKMEPRNAIEKMAGEIVKNGRGTITREAARKIAEKSARRVDHRANERGRK